MNINDIKIGHMVELLKEDSDRGIAYRELIKNLSSGTVQFHGNTDAKADVIVVPFTPAQMVTSYLETLQRHITGGRLMVPDNVKQARRDACNRCEYRDAEKDACKICRCSLSPSELEATVIGDKLRWAVASCPLPEPAWKEYTGSS